MATTFFDGYGVTAAHLSLGVGRGKGCEIVGPNGHGAVRMSWEAAHALATAILYFDTHGAEIPEREPEPPAAVRRELPPELCFRASAGELDLAGKSDESCMVCYVSCVRLDGTPTGRQVLRRVPGGWRKAGTVCEAHALDLRALFP